MKHSLFFTLIIVLFFGCSKEPNQPFKELPKTYLIESSFAELPGFYQEHFSDILENFKNNCRSAKAQKIYASLCKQAESTTDAKSFFLENFTPYQLTDREGEKEGLLTAYYEPLLFGSRKRSQRYAYPLYESPKDLLIIDLSSVYPELKKYRLRGRVRGNRVVPYSTRAESAQEDLNASVICYCDSKVDKFFLEIQGSGRVQLDDNSTIFIGYDNQNGHKYRAIGRYLVTIGALTLENVSLQSIKAWLDAHPERVDEVLNYNDSLVFFKERSQGATGALGLELTPYRSIAVDRSRVPLGSMLYLHSKVQERPLEKIVFAQDTGGAIKGAVRADLFVGAGEDALEVAGRMKAPLELWILMPKSKRKSKK